MRKKARLSPKDQTGTQSLRKWDTKVRTELGANWINGKAELGVMSGFEAAGRV